MRKIGVILFLVLAISVNAFGNVEPKVYFIGTDNDVAKVESITFADYQGIIKEVNFGFENYLQNQLPENFVTQSNFKLSTISLGIGASFEVGVGPWKRGLSIRHRYYYTR